jgi:hypothetical protein
MEGLGDELAATSVSPVDTMSPLEEGQFQLTAKVHIFNSNKLRLLTVLVSHHDTSKAH